MNHRIPSNPNHLSHQAVTKFSCDPSQVRRARPVERPCLAQCLAPCLAPCLAAAGGARVHRAGGHPRRALGSPCVGVWHKRDLHWHDRRARAPRLAIRFAVLHGWKPARLTLQQPGDALTTAKLLLQPVACSRPDLRAAGPPPPRGQTIFLSSMFGFTRLAQLSQLPFHFFTFSRFHRQSGLSACGQTTRTVLTRIAHEQTPQQQLTARLGELACALDGFPVRDLMADCLDTTPPEPAAKNPAYLLVDRVLNQWIHRLGQDIDQLPPSTMAVTQAIAQRTHATRDALIEVRGLFDRLVAGCDTAAVAPAGTAPA